MDPKEENNKSDIMAGVLEAMEDFKPLKRGQIITGSVVTMTDEGVLAGIKYDDNHLLIAVTEKRTKQELDKYVDAMKKVLNE